MSVLKDIADLVPRYFRLTFAWWRYADTFDDHDQLAHAFWRWAASLGIFLITLKLFSETFRSHVGQIQNTVKCPSAYDAVMANEIGVIFMILFQVVPVALLIWLITSWRIPRPRLRSIFAVTLDSYMCLVVSGSLGYFIVTVALNAFGGSTSNAVGSNNLVVSILIILFSLLWGFLILHQVLILPALLMQRAQTISIPLRWGIATVFCAWVIVFSLHKIVDPPITCQVGELVLRFSNGLAF